MRIVNNYSPVSITPKKVFLVVDSWQYDGGVDILSAHSDPDEALKAQQEYRRKLNQTENTYYHQYGKRLTPSHVHEKRLESVHIRMLSYE